MVEVEEAGGGVGELRRSLQSLLDVAGAAVCSFPWLHPPSRLVTLDSPSATEAELAPGPLPKPGSALVFVLLETSMSDISGGAKGVLDTCITV